MAKRPTRYEYPYIRAWGQLLGSLDYYIQGQVEQAQSDSAPKDAIYKAANGRWRRWSDMKDDNSNKEKVRLLAERIDTNV